MFASLGRLIYRQRWATLIVGLAFVVASGVFGTSVFGDLKGGGFYAPDAESTKVMESLHTDLGQDEGTLIALFTAKDGATVDSPEYKAAVEGTLAKLGGVEGVGQITTYYSTGSASLVSNDKQSTFAVIGLVGGEEADAKTLLLVRPLLTSERLDVRLGGAAAINEEITEQVQRDLETAETLTFPIVAVLLIIIFGSLVAAALPLAIGATAILGSFLVLRVVANYTDVSIFAINIITMLGLGLAIDYSLFMVSRFREELPRHGGDVSSALARTMATAGRTVLFSGLTVAISLLSLQVFPQMFLKSMGTGGAAAVVVAMVAALTLLPAILALLGGRVNALSITSIFRRGRKQPVAREESAAPSGFWYRLSQVVMRRPGVVLVLALIPMLVAGLPFLRINFSIADARGLPAHHESRQVSDFLSANFPSNETAPVQIVVQTEGDALAPAGLDALYSYTRQVENVRGVRRVDSLVNLDPRLDQAAYKGFYSEAGRAQNPGAAMAAARFSEGNYSLVTVLYDGEPLSTTNQELVRNIRSIEAPQGLSAQVGGFSAVLVDFLGSLASSVPVALALMVGVIFVLLFLMLGSVVVPLKAVILNILSLSVSFGALVWIFQDGNFANILGFTPLGSVEATQPVLIFAIAFGLSMDYEVFLLSRIKEQYDRTGDMKTSVAHGMQKTGAIITSAALLLAVVIAGFAMGEVVFIKQIGVGLTLAILVDATIVRGLLVPASMQLMGKYNWWAPRPLKALYNRLGMGEVESEEPVATKPAPALEQTSAGA